MKTSGPLKCFIVLVSLVLLAPQARAQGQDEEQAQEWIHLNPIEWEAKVEFETIRESIEGSSPTRDSEVKTGITFNQSGFVFDPRIATFSVEANPVISRGKFDSSIRDETRDGEFLNFNIRLGALEGAPLPFSGFFLASRTTDTTKASLGSRSSFRNQNAYLGINWKNRAFPSTLSLSQRSMRQTFQSGLSTATSERDELERAITFRGRSSKMDFFAEHLSHDDRVAATDHDFTNDRFRLHNLFRWGKGSRFDSRIEYLDRSGFLGYDRFTASETATIQHTRSLSTSYGYNFTSFSQTQDTVEHVGDFTLTHNLYNNLTTTFQTEIRSSDFDVSTEDEYRGRLDFEYTKKIIWDGRVTAGLGGGYGVTDRVSSDGLTEVVNESHGVDSSRLVLLAQQFVETSTIVVTDALGSFVFSEGTDYTIVPAADNFTQLSILPGGTINVGDTILVSYKYQTLPSARFSTIPYQAHAALDFDWISVFARISGEEEALLKGTDQRAVTDRLNGSVGVELRWRPRPGLSATFAVEHRTLISGAFNSSSINFSQSLFYRLNARTALNLTANQDFITSDGQKTDLFTTDLGLRWRPLRGMTVSPHVGVWMRDEKGVSNERFFSGGVDVEYSIGLVSLRLSYTHERRTGTVTDRDEDRIMLTIVRKSR